MNFFSSAMPCAKPFLKWAGGKTQLLPAIERLLPKGIEKKKSLTYCEPFVGSGAMAFWFLQKFPTVEHAFINDINTDLTQAYTTIKEQPQALIDVLSNMQDYYFSLSKEEERKLFFLGKRAEFNTRQSDPIENTALLIFLNRTCFNGLYRVNSQNVFNVPFGRYDKPKICDPETIMADSQLLQRVTILNGDYENTLKYLSEDSFTYFDPPYKPISKTASFNSYSKASFGDAEQMRLKRFCDLLTEKGGQWLLSNSDPKNENPNDNFFEELFFAEGISIDRVKARRAINSNAAKRGEINELLIYNY